MLPLSRVRLFCGTNLLLFTLLFCHLAAFSSEPPPPIPAQCWSRAQAKGSYDDVIMECGLCYGEVTGIMATPSGCGQLVALRWCLSDDTKCKSGCDAPHLQVGACNPQLNQVAQNAGPEVPVRNPCGTGKKWSVALERCVDENPSSSKRIACMTAVDSTRNACRAPSRQPMPTDSAAIDAMCAQMKNESSKTSNMNIRRSEACSNTWRDCAKKCHEAGLTSHANQCEQIGPPAVELLARGSEIAGQTEDISETCRKRAVKNDPPGDSPPIQPHTQPQAPPNQNASQDPNKKDQNQNPMGGMPGLGGGGSPQSDQSQLDPYGCEANPNSPACVQCTSNPTHPACLALSEEAKKLEMAESGFGTGGENAGEMSPEEFNVDPYNSAPAEPGFYEPQSTATAAVVPNNSGGGFGMGGGNNGYQNPRGGGGSPGAPGFGNQTDIEGGFRSGGFGGYSSGYNSGDSSGRGSSWGEGGRGPANAVVGKQMDLRQYLPGGKHDPGTRLGGAYRPTPGIHGPGVDIWLKVNSKVLERCRLGNLYDCQ